MPKHLVTLHVDRTYTLELTNHAKRACETDRYGKLCPPPVVTLREKDIIELEYDGQVVTKLVVRRSYDVQKDIVMVIIPMGRIGRVKTLWFNLKTDTHKTLKSWLYAKT